MGEIMAIIQGFGININIPFFVSVPHAQIATLMALADSPVYCKSNYDFFISQI